LTSVLLADTVEQVLGDFSRQQEMAAAMKKLAFPQAAEEITDVCLQLAAQHQSR
jgi:UDP-N-acetylglucosamine:LPS N-acetylglucosamine transferase